MYSTKELLHQIADPNLSNDQRSQLRCQLARQLEEAGNFEAARDAMGDLWRRVGERPEVEGLNQQTAAAVLLRVGALTGHIGSAQQIQGSQETAKNLLSESYSIFERLQKAELIAEAQIEIAVCYWREGAFDEARVMLQEALRKLGETGSELKPVALLRLALVETFAKRLHDAFRIQNESAALFEALTNSVLKGKFHHLFGTVLKKLAVAEQRQDYLDHALIEYTAASFYFERAGVSRYQACVENNLGFLFGTIGKFAEAHEHLDRAQALFTSLKDKVHLAQVDETRARVMIAEGRVAEAEKMVRVAVQTLEKGGEQSLLAEALTTQGVALARLHHEQRARTALERAIEVGEQAGDPESAGLAALVMIEELSAHLSSQDLNFTIERAEELLKNTQDMSTLRRLVTCACRVAGHLYASPDFPPSVDWTKFSLNDEVLRYEAYFIRLALKESGGRPTSAAHLLGFKHHQSLLALLNGRHKDLRDLTRPVIPRKRSMIGQQQSDHVSSSATRDSLTFRILHVEDNQVVADALRETLEMEGWEVETCSDGTTALEKLVGNIHYDLLLLDYDLPGVDGIELVRRARNLAHRSRTPIVVLSATPVAAEARRVGADAFLNKPQDIPSIVETLGQLLGTR